MPGGRRASLLRGVSRSGANITGLALVTDDVKALQILKEAVPGVSRAAFIYDPSTLPGRFGETWLSRARTRARTFKVDLQLVLLRKPDDADQVFAALPDKTDAVLVGNSATNALARRRLCVLAAQRGIPAVSIERAFADAGCLMSYGEDQLDMHRRAAGYVDNIFKGANVADLPVEQPTRFQLVVNLKAAKALNLDIPPIILARADEVIE